MKKTCETDSAPPPFEARQDSASPPGSCEKITGADNPEFVSWHLDTMENRAKMTAMCAKNLLAACRKMEDLLSLVDPFFGCGTPDPPSAKTLDITETAICHFEQTVLRECETIYQTISHPVSCAGIRSPEIAEKEDHLRLGQCILGIDAWTSDDKVFVKLPMLGRRIPSAGTGHLRASPSYDYSKIYANHVATAVHLAIENLRISYDCFLEKTLSFLFVYSPLSGSIIDSDSHDTKAIIDAIAIQFPGGDAATLCSFSFSSIVSNRFPEGTYVCVSAGKNTFQDDSFFEKSLRTHEESLQK